MDQEKETQTTFEIRNAIVVAALKLFVEKGYFNTSLTEISEAVGLKNTSAIYTHFANKQAIANELYTTIFDSLNVSIDDIRRRNQKSSEQLRGIVDLLFKLTDEAPYVMHFILNTRINEFLPQVKPVQDTAAFVKIIKIIQTGMRAGEIRSIDAKLCYAYFFGVINEALRLMLSGMFDKKADAYQSQTWLVAWNMIAAKK
jgi:AcrR family transcriptional regulator